MKRSFLILYCLILVLSSVSIGYCEGENWTTENLPNGHFIIDNINHGEESPEYFIAEYYCSGLLDGVVSAGGRKKMTELYGTDAMSADIFKNICLYYKNNPDQQSKPVIDVLLSGAK